MYILISKQTPIVAKINTIYKENYTTNLLWLQQRVTLFLICNIILIFLLFISYRSGYLVAINLGYTDTIIKAIAVAVISIILLLSLQQIYEIYFLISQKKTINSLRYIHICLYTMWIISFLICCLKSIYVKPEDKYKNIANSLIDSLEIHFKCQLDNATKKTIVAFCIRLLNEDKEEYLKDDKEECFYKDPNILTKMNITFHMIAQHIYTEILLIDHNQLDIINEDEKIIFKIILDSFASVIRSWYHKLFFILSNIYILVRLLHIVLRCKQIEYILLTIKQKKKNITKEKQCKTKKNKIKEIKYN